MTPATPATAEASTGLPAMVSISSTTGAISETAPSEHQPGPARPGRERRCSAPRARASRDGGRRRPSSCKTGSIRGRTGCRRASSSRRAELASPYTESATRVPTVPIASSRPAVLRSPPALHRWASMASTSTSPERVGGGSEADEQSAGGPDVRPDQKDPRQEADPEGDDEGVEQAGLVAARHP